MSRESQIQRESKWAKMVFKMQVREDSSVDRVPAETPRAWQQPGFQMRSEGHHRPIPRTEMADIFLTYMLFLQDTPKFAHKMRLPQHLNLSHAGFPETVLLYFILWPLSQTAVVLIQAVNLLAACVDLGK